MKWRWIFTIWPICWTTMVTCKYGYRLNFVSFFFLWSGHRLLAEQIGTESLACVYRGWGLGWGRPLSTSRILPPLNVLFVPRHGSEKTQKKALLVAVPDDFQNEMMVLAFAATLMATIPILLGNEFDVNVGLKKKKVNLNKWNDTLPVIRKKPSSFCRENAEVCLRITGRWNQLMVME